MCGRTGAGTGCLPACNWLHEATHPACPAVPLPSWRAAYTYLLLVDA